MAIVITQDWLDVIDRIVMREDPQKGYDSIVNVPGDRGGLTRAGITYNNAIRFWRADPNRNSLAGLALMNSLTRADIQEYYFIEHIKKPNYTQLPQDIMEMVVDFGVTSGPSNSTKVLQRAINNVVSGNLVVDGRLGNRTLAIINEVNIYRAEWEKYFITRLTKEIVRQRILFYIRIIENDPSQVKFIEGWFERAYSFLPAA